MKFDIWNIPWARAKTANEWVRVCLCIFLGVRPDKPNSVCWTDCAHFVHLCVVIRTQLLPPWRKCLLRETYFYKQNKSNKWNKFPLLFCFLMKQKGTRKREGQRMVGITQETEGTWAFLWSLRCWSSQMNPAWTEHPAGKEETCRRRAEVNFLFQSIQSYSYWCLGWTVELVSCLICCLYWCTLSKCFVVYCFTPPTMQMFFWVTDWPYPLILVSFCAKNTLYTRSQCLSGLTIYPIPLS